MGGRFPWRERRMRIAVAGLALLLLSGCDAPAFTNTPFQREAGDAASSYSAAATTLEFLHDGKLDRRYARASLLVYHEAMQGKTAAVARADGAPARLGPVINRMQRADAVLADPCLDDDCDWQAQVDTLRDAQHALTEVSQ